MNRELLISLMSEAGYDLVVLNMRHEERIYQWVNYYRAINRDTGRWYNIEITYDNDEPDWDYAYSTFQSKCGG